MEADYIRIMAESLEKKKDILDRIIELNRQQKFLLQDPNLSPEDFEQNMKFKGELIEQLNFLDDGFEELFGRVRDALNTNRQQYADEITQIQGLIRDIMTRTTEIQAQEARNHESAVNKFSTVRSQVRGVRNSQKVVKQYYDNMMSHRSAEAQTIDNKK